MADLKAVLTAENRGEQPCPIELSQSLTALILSTASRE
jgi:hypothetical protein